MRDQRPQSQNRMLQPKSEFKEKILDLRRVTRVVAGGKRMSFRATVVLGDEKGKVGIGVGKGLDVAQAVDKAKIKAKREMVLLPLKGSSIPHEVVAKYSAASVVIKPAKAGHGLKAGGAVRNVLLLAGIKDATSKITGKTKNKLTNAVVALEALKKLKKDIRKASKSEQVAEVKQEVKKDEE